MLHTFTFILTETHLLKRKATDIFLVLCTENNHSYAIQVKDSHFHSIFVYKLVSYYSFPKLKEARRLDNMLDSIAFGSHFSTQSNYICEWENNIALSMNYSNIGFL